MISGFAGGEAAKKEIDIETVRLVDWRMTDVEYTKDKKRKSKSSSKMFSEKEELAAHEPMTRKSGWKKKIRGKDAWIAFFADPF